MNIIVFIDTCSNSRCHNLTSVSSALYKILPNYCATYVPIAIVMIVNPIIYMLASKDVEMAVALPLAQVCDIVSYHRINLYSLMLLITFIKFTFKTVQLPFVPWGVFM